MTTPRSSSVLLLTLVLIVVVTAQPIITTVAGREAAPNIGDGGLATNATLVASAGVAVDASGDFWIAEWVS